MRDFNPTMFMKLNDGNIIGLDKKLSSCEENENYTSYFNVVFIIDYFSEDGFRTIPIKEICIMEKDIHYTWEVEK